ncbi:MAG TPA: hypothetical protein VF756_16125 [Thermoanaerobaculia bacterium]
MNNRSTDFVRQAWFQHAVAGTASVVTLAVSPIVLRTLAFLSSDLVSIDLGIPSTLSAAFAITLFAFLPLSLLLLKGARGRMILLPVPVVGVFLLTLILTGAWLDDPFFRLLAAVVTAAGFGAYLSTLNRLRSDFVLSLIEWAEDDLR